MKTVLHVYTRVSSLIQQEEGTSLENQKQLGIKKAAELGFDFRLWNEGGQSSFYDDLNNRPALVSLLSLIETGAVEHLFVYNTDRLSRNQQTWAVIRYKLIKHGVILHTASGQMSLKNPVDDLMLGILSEISQYDNRIRTERSRMGRFQKVQQGNWKGGPPPFGYRLINRRLEIDPFESDWIRLIYEWYCTGKSTKEIQATLSRNGVATRRGHHQWSLGSIQLILRNPIYTGLYRYTDKMLGETVQVQAPLIISSITFQNAQDRRKTAGKRGVASRTTKHFYLLRGLLACGHCGALMGGRINRAGHQNVYYCVTKERSWKNRTETHTKWKRGESCSMVRSINITKTNEAVWKIVGDVYRKVRENYLLLSEQNHPDNPELNDTNQLLTEQISWLSAEQIDLLSGEQKRDFLNGILTNITVRFDRETSRHQLTVEFNQQISRHFELKPGADRSASPADQSSRTGGDPVTSTNPTGDVGGHDLKKRWGSRIGSAAEFEHSVTVE